MHNYVFPESPSLSRRSPQRDDVSDANSPNNPNGIHNNSNNSSNRNDSYSYHYGDPYDDADAVSDSLAPVAEPIMDTAVDAPTSNASAQGDGPTVNSKLLTNRQSAGLDRGLGRRSLAYASAQRSGSAAQPGTSSAGRSSVSRGNTATAGGTGSGSVVRRPSRATSAARRSASQSSAGGESGTGRRGRDRYSHVRSVVGEYRRNEISALDAQFRSRSLSVSSRRPSEAPASYESGVDSVATPRATSASARSARGASVASSTARTPSQQRPRAASAHKRPAGPPRCATDIPERYRYHPKTEEEKEEEQKNLEELRKDFKRRASTPRSAPQRKARPSPLAYSGEPPKQQPQQSAKSRSGAAAAASASSSSSSTTTVSAPSDKGDDDVDEVLSSMHSSRASSAAPANREGRSLSRIEKYTKKRKSSTNNAATTSPSPQQQKSGNPQQSRGRAAPATADTDDAQSVGGSSVWSEPPPPPPRRYSNASGSATPKARSRSRTSLLPAKERAQHSKAGSRRGSQRGADKDDVGDGESVDGVASREVQLKSRSPCAPAEATQRARSRSQGGVTSPANATNYSGASPSPAPDRGAGARVAPSRTGAADRGGAGGAAAPDSPSPSAQNGALMALPTETADGRRVNPFGYRKKLVFPVDAPTVKINS